MKPIFRKPVSKASSSRRFRKNASKTKGMNLRMNPMRGGWRL